MLMTTVLVYLLLAIVVSLLSKAFKPGVRDVPGPFLAKFTDLYRAYYAWRGDLFKKFQEWQKTYGNYVRIGPNTILICESDVFQEVLGARKEFPKSDFQKPWRQVVNGKVFETIASTQNKRTHAELKKPIATTFSMTNILPYEPRVDSTLKHFLTRLDEEFMQGSNAGKPCDIDNWLQYFAYDVVGEVTLSRRLGFLQEGRDVDSLLHSLDTVFDYRGTVSNAPWLDTLLLRNPLYLALRSPTLSFLKRAKSDLLARLSELKSCAAAGKPDTHKDLLSSFLEAKAKHPKIVNDNVLGSYVTASYLAGSDTTAVALRSIMYHALRTPGCVARMRDELRDAGIAQFPVPFKRAHSLAYLDAVIREGMRVHWVVSFGLERVVPPEKGDWTMRNGVVLPVGTQVAFSGWNLHFNEDVWGADAHIFKPERWLKGESESVEEYHERLARMNRNDLTFSYGPRICLGKNLALMEIYMAVPTLFGLLDIELVDPAKEWNVKGSFFSKQSEMDMKISWRKGADPVNFTLANED